MSSNNPYDALLDEEAAQLRQQQAATVSAVVDLNPDKVAQQRRTATVLGLPPAAVAATPEQSQREATTRGVLADTSNNPVLQRAYSKVDFAELAHDDSSALSKLGDAVAATTRYLMNADSTSSTGRGLVDSVRAGYAKAGAGIAGAGRAALEPIAPLLDFLEGVNSIGGNPLRRLAEGFAMEAEAGNKQAERVGGPAPHAGFVRSAVDSGVQSLTGNLLVLPAALLPGGQPAALAAMVAQTGGLAYQQAREQNVPVLGALTFASGQAIVEYATEKMPLGALVKDLQKMAPIHKVVAHQLASELPGEQVATVLQDLNEWAVLPQNTDKTFKDYLAERPSAAVQTLIATLVGVGGNIAVGQAMQTAVDRLGNRQYQIDQATADGERLAEIFKLASASKLRERDPQTLASLVQEMADNTDGAPSQVFIDARMLAGEGGLLNQEQIDELLPSVAPQLEEALAVGGDVSVPLGELVGSVSGTPLEQKLLEHLRTTQDGLSPFEAKQASEQAAEYLQSAAAKAIDDAADKTDVQLSADKVKATIMEQLAGANRFTPEVHDAYSSLVRDFYTVMASRLGVAPEQAYAAYPLRVAAVNPATGNLQQAAYHGTHARGIKQFSLDKIGTGEGAQVYGHGLYFASNAEVAEFYRKTVSRNKEWTPEETATLPPTLTKAESDEFSALGQKMMKNGNLPAAEMARWRELKTAYVAREEAVQKLTRGQLYSVEVPNNDVLLDRDALFKDQPEKVRKALELLGINPTMWLVKNASGTTLQAFKTKEEARRYFGANNVNGSIKEHDTRITGTDVYEMLSARLGGDKAASEALRAAGIPGLRYLDANSRDPNDPTKSHNFVIFDDSAVQKTGEFYQSRVEPPTENDADRAASNNGARVSPRMPTGVRATESGYGDTKLQPTIAAMPDTLVEKTAAEFLKYPNFAGLAGTPQEILQQAKQHMKGNLRALMQLFPADLTERARMWYVGGNRIARALSELYGVPAENIALAMAALSPQKNWFENVGMAERVVDIVVLRSQTAWSKEMTAVANARGWFQDEKIAAYVADAEGKTLREMYDPADEDSFIRMAWWVRAYDEAHNPRTTSVITPEGTFLEAQFSDRADGQPTPVRWSGARDIGKAIAALVARTPEARSKLAGGAHKVRSFFNNIVAPYAGDDVTIDTHAVAAALLRPLGGTTHEVMNVLSGAVSASDAALGFASVGNSAITGSSGAYAVYADAYREVAAEFGLLPREVQSITWEAVRLLFNAKGATLKRDTADTWAAFSRGELTHEQAVQRIVELAGGIGRPDWASGTGTPQPYGSSFRRSELDAPDRQFAGDLASTVDVAGELYQTESGGLPDGVGVRGSVERVDDAGKPLEGLPAVVRVDGKQVTFGPHAPARAAAERYMARAGLPYVPPTTYAKVDSERAARIAAAFEAMQHAPNDLEVKAAYDALIRETVAQWQAIKETGLQVEFITGPDPYGNPRNAILDVVENNHLWVFPTTDGFGGSESADVDITGNPLLATVPGETISGRPVVVNDLFRIVHDYFGHIKEGVGFRAEGEENAWRSHWSMFSPLARAALTTETRGQNSWVNFGPFAVANRTADAANTQYAPQKIGLLPAWAINEGASDVPSPIAPTVGIHYGKEPRTRLDGSFFGTGLKGAESERLAETTDERLKDRVYVYIDEGKGVRPESGVGAFAHEVQLPALYDAKADPLGLWSGGDINASESRILDAGFAGYFVRNAFNGQGAAVVIGPRSHGLQAKVVPNPAVDLATVEPPKPYRRALLSSELNALDIGKVQAAAPSAQLKSGTLSVDMSDFAAAREAAAAQGVELPEPLAQGPRGSFNPGSLTITLLEKADLSTFLHETGHFFLEVMADVSAQAEAPLGIREDMAAVLQWFGVKDLATWNAMSLDEKRPHHEKFAESFEHYLFEGKAPSHELQPLFQRFRSWMTSVYRSLTDFLASHNTSLTSEVRGVFDRMLAADDAIKAAEAARAYAPAIDAPEVVAASQKATERAIDTLQTRSLRDLRWTTNARSKALRALQKDAAEKRKAVQAEVEAELAATPLEQARAYVAELQKAAAAASKEHKKARNDWNAEYGAAKLKVTEAVKADEAFTNADERKLEVQRRMLQWEVEHPAPLPEVSEADMDIAAEQFGFTSGDELAGALRTAPPMAEMVEGMTDQRLLERYGDLTTSQGIERAADEAVHNEARGRALATSLKALMEAGTETEETGKTIKSKTKAGKPITRAQTVNVIVRAAKEFAATMIARQKVRDLKPGKHRSAETRAGKAMMDAMAAGKTQEAIAAQRDQLLNHFAARESDDARAEVDKAVRKLRALADNTTLPPEYQEQIDTLLDRFDLRDTPLKAVDKRKSLQQWIESQRAIGVEPELAPELLDEARRTSYKDMTVEEFRGLVDAIKQIEHLGRLKSKLLTAKDQRDFETTRDDIAASIIANAGERQADTRTPTTNLGRWFQAVKNFGAAHIKAATLARVFDGGKDGGPMWETFVRTANERGDFETTERAAATQALTDILGPWLKAGKNGGKGIYFPSVKRSFNRESLLAIALNTGNEGNLQRLLGGEGWTMQQLQPVLDTLGRKDWEVVQQVWDYIATYRPRIAEKQKRVYGVEPEWVQPVPRTVTLADGSTLELRGGYYPIKYDPAASVRAEEHADAEGAKRQLQGAYGAATTRRSFTKTRAEEVTGRPLLYTMMGVYSGVNDVIHDLAWHEWLIDTNRLLKSEAIDGAIREHYGPEYVRQLKTWRDDIAEGDGQMQAALDGALGALRQGVSAAGLGFNVMSALMQPLGFAQSIVRVGAPWVARGVARYIGNPAAATRDVKERSEFMRNRGLTLNRELNELRNKIQGEGNLRTGQKRYTYFLMQQLQQAVDVPTWIGAYEKAIADGNDEARAVSLADQAVTDAQGSGRTQDLSAIERGGPAQKLFTVFYSFMNTALNLGVASKMGPDSKARFAVNMLMLYTVPAVLGSMLKDAFTPGDAGDDDDPRKLARKLIGEQLSYLMGLMVVTREFSEAGKAAIGAADHPRDYAGPAGVRVIADATQAAKQAQQGEFDTSFRKAIINLVGSVFGLPAAQINRTLTGAQALKDGKTQNPAALLTGYQEPR